ncbi:MAG: hypothetical protein IJ412_07590 [Oscillospiraceae bacterium]|nr:hypothetical protein [Oscillospiraceae bacterium]
MKHILSDHTFPADPHTPVQADFSVLDGLYAGKKAYYGDYHGHSDSGGTSDGKTTPEQWLQAMPQLGMDFLGLMDHRQVRHQYLDCFDETVFLYGSEPAGLWHEPYTDFHYLMLFQKRESLEQLLEQFPDVFEFTGGIEGHFKYIRVERARFAQVVEAIRALGGAFVHPHPRQVMVSDNAADYSFGDGTAIETIYCCEYPEPLNPHTAENYRLWLQLLDEGHRVYNTATADAHGGPTNVGVNTVYASRRHGAAFVRQLIAGDVTAGFAGIKMAVGSTPMGGTAAKGDGQTLCVRIDDVHPQLFDPAESYRVNIHTDRGLAYSAPLVLPFAAALPVQDRRFYRVEVLRERDGSPAAIGNPIWLE